MVIRMTALKLDFKRLRAEADFAVVLGSYGIDLRKDGSRPGQFKALCPFHEDKDPSLKVNTDKNIYHCFVCEAKGNVLDFVMNMDGIGIRPAALKVASLCGLGGEAPLPPTKLKSSVKTKTGVGKAAADTAGAAKAPDPEKAIAADTSAADASNPVLSFALKLEDTAELATWLLGRGLSATDVATFGLGQVSARSKSIARRLAIPIHNRTGDLVAYCGRYIGDTIPDDVPKYILPKGFRKDLELFNLHRVTGLSPAPNFVILFESFFSVMRHGAHVPSVSAMGRTISEAQIALLRDAGITKVVVVFDGDDPGRLGGREAAGALAPYVWTRVVDLPLGTKPHHLAWEDLRPLLRAAWREDRDET
jgi:DNA primase